FVRHSCGATPGPAYVWSSLSAPAEPSTTGPSETCSQPSKLAICSDLTTGPRMRVFPMADSSETEMISLDNLDARQVAAIALRVPGGRDNIQDIHPLSPLQEGIVSRQQPHGPPDAAGIDATIMSVESRDQLEHLIDALQCVVDRHDALRTAVI